jgi:Ca2+-binding EF-hand superfamily protein
MSRATAILCLLTVAGVAGRGMGQESPAPVLLLPGARHAIGLQLNLVIDGKSPTAAWKAFLDRLFDFFDRNGDGSLSRDEASRMMPLPLPGGKVLAIDFARLDADGDGKATRAELKSYCRANGFGPVVAVIEPPAADDLRIAAQLLRCLGADGKLTRARLLQAPALLRQCDLNDDEYLDPAELLVAAPAPPKPVPPQVQLADGGGEADARLRLDLGTKAPAVRLDSAGSMRLVPASAPGDVDRLYGNEGRWALALRATRTVPDAAAAGAFLLAQFQSVLGDRPALAKADLEDDPALGGFRELLPFADRNGDGRLTQAELQDYFALVEMGMRAQIWVRVIDCGGNPLYLLDSDADGRLSYRELTRAAELLHPTAAEGTGLPLQFRLVFGGPAVRAWGGVPIPAIKPRTAPAPADAAAAPRWFRAMDRNGDGVISPREFVGPPEAFRKLDRNGDGVITRDEAIRADHP